MQFTRAIMGFCVLGLVSATSLAQTPLTSEWAYQGSLSFDGMPLNETVDLQFTLWDADTSGNQIGTMLAAVAVPVVDGRFTVQLDFGVNAFNGDARWLEIAVARIDTSFVSLSPRQPVTVVPYALQTRGFVMDQFGNAIVGPFEGNRATGLRSTVSGGDNNEARSGGTVSGGSGNTAWSSSAIGGGSSNSAAALAGNSAIAGGRGNTSSGAFGVIGGGEDNSVSDRFALVAGGEENVASNRYAVVGGGRNNTASGLGAVVPGGENNVASRDYTFAGGRNAQSNHVGTFVWAADGVIPFQSTEIRQFLISAEKGVGINTNNPQGVLDVVGEPGSEFFIGRDLGDNPIIGTDSIGNLNLRPRWNGTGSVVVRNDASSSGIRMSTHLPVVDGGRLNHIESIAEDGVSPYPLTLNAFGGDVRLAPGGLGNVGIGTYLPSGPLQVGDPSDAAALKLGSSGPHHLVSNRDLVLNAFDRNQGADGDVLLSVRSNTNAFDETTFQDLLTVADNGRLGVGVSQPQARLHVGGTAGVDGIMFPDGTVQTTAASGGRSYITTRRTANPSLYPDPWCPDGWTIEDSWTYRIWGETVTGRTLVRETLCSCDCP